MDNWIIRHKGWSIIISLLIIFFVFVYFLPENSEEAGLTGKVIDEGIQDSSEQIETQKQEISYQSEEDGQTNYTKIQEQPNQEEECNYGYLEEYRCNEADIEQKYQHSNCSSSWFFYDLCPYGCDDGKCNSEPEESLNKFLVTYVVDGDTIEIETGERVRLICIDTPETYEEGYQEAKNYLSNLILNKEVYLKKDISETDRYGRLLRYIYTKEDCTDLANCFINLRIVLQGYGRAYPYSPDTTLCPQIQTAESMAKENKIGIWAETIEEPVEEIPPSSNIICSYNAYNCGDFSSCSEVMEVFNYCSSDIHYLDGDDDGIPCESLCG